MAPIQYPTSISYTSWVDVKYMQYLCYNLIPGL